MSVTQILKNGGVGQLALLIVRYQYFYGFLVYVSLCSVRYKNASLIVRMKYTITRVHNVCVLCVAKRKAGIL